MTLLSRVSRTSFGCILSGLLFHAVALALILGIWLAVGLPYGARRLDAAHQAWSRAFTADEGFRNRYPERQDSAAALRIDAIARRMGRFVSPRPDDYKPGHPPHDMPTWKPLTQFVASLQNRDSDVPITVPAPVNDVVTSRSAELQQIEDVLLEGSSVEWRTANAGMPSVDLLGLRRLHAMLLVRALTADARGATAARNRTLEAAWRLEQTMEQRPELLDWLMSQVFSGARNACLRRFASVPDQWLHRVQSPDRRAAIVDAYQYEAQTYCRSSRRLMGYADADYLSGGEPPSVGAMGSLIRYGSAPLFRAHVAYYADRLREEAEALRRVDPCTIDRESHLEQVKRTIPHTSVVARESLPALLGAWWTARATALQDELTFAVLHERPLMAAADAGNWSKASSICPSLTWLSTTSRPDLRGDQDPKLEESDLVHYTITAR